MEAIRDLSDENLLLTQFRVLGFRSAERDEARFGAGEVLFGEDVECDSVLFPRRPLFVSYLRTLENGSSVEVSMVGWEGMLGLHALSRPPGNPGIVIAQHAGSAIRMPHGEFREICRRSEGVRDAVLRYQNYISFHLGQTALCNRFHTVGSRLARWLLMMHDRTTADDYEVTQEYMAQLLGVRLASVNEAVGALVHDGGLSHGRSRVSIADRFRLEQSSCECYFTIAREQRRLLSPMI